MLCSKTSPIASLSTALCAVLVLLLGPAPAHAFGNRCEPNDAPPRSTRAHSLRDKVSRFAPRLEIVFWFEPSADHRSKEEARPGALSAAPETTPLPSSAQLHAKAREPYGWQVSVRWDLVEMAEAVHPALGESPPTLLSTECFDHQSRARRLLLDDLLAEDEGGDDE